MSTNVLLTLTFAFLLTGCFPAQEISPDNAEQLLAATARTQQLAKSTQLAFNASNQTAITNQSLQRYLVRSAHNISLECAQNQGDLTLSLSANQSDFTLLFNQCQGDDGGTLNGSVEGQITLSDLALEAQMTGQLEARFNGDSVLFQPIHMHLDISDRQYLVAHNGSYYFDTKGYKGEVVVVTEEPVGYNFLTLNYQGKVSYTDEQQNTLTVEHDNNGVHLYYNGGFFKSYRHDQWQEKF